MAVCLHLDLNYLDFSDKLELDKVYQSGLKKVLKVLYTTPKFFLTLSVPGMVLDYYSKKFPEAIELLKELSSRSQIEILGGGFFAPILSLLHPSDRSGQIEKMTTLVRSITGKRPRGISLYASCWDNSLIQPLKACGFDYVFLDESLVHDAGVLNPLIVMDYGKNVKVLVSKKSLSPQEAETFSFWKKRIFEALKKDSLLHNEILSIDLDLEQILRLCDKKFLSDFLADELGENLLTPVAFFKNCSYYKSAFIPSGMQKKIGTKKTYNSIYDYLFDFQPAMHLYDRMIYINMLISQPHCKDKMRKKAAQEKLWEAQCGNLLISLKQENLSTAKQRQSAYKLLNEAERYLREGGQFLEALTSFDYNCDGFNEYVFQSENFNAVISPFGGKISDLNILSSGANYTDSFSQKDGFEASGFMIESLSEKEPEKNSLSENDLSWSAVLFKEKKFDGKRKEVILESENLFSQMKMPVSLQKKIIASSTGFMVQYIVKNLSPFQLKAYFSVSFNLAQTDFLHLNENQYDLELIQDGQRIKPGKSKCVFKNGISMLQIIDTDGKMTMLFEPNEEAGFISETELTKNFEKDGKNQNIRFYWPVDLASGRAMEKTLNFMLIPTKKNFE